MSDYLQDVTGTCFSRDPEDSSRRGLRDQFRRLKVAGRLRLKYGRDGRGGDKVAMGNRRTRSHERSRET